MTLPTSPVYCTSADVWNFLQRTGGTDFTTTTFPTQATVNDIIMRCEREIERRTGKSWKIVAVTDLDAQDYEYHDLGPYWSYFNYGLIHRPRMQLNHPDIVTPLDTAQGDSLQFSQGGVWQEMLPPTGSFTQGDFASNVFINGSEGILYIPFGYPIIRYPDGIRIRYRYGRSIVDPWVKDCAIKLAAIQVIELDTKNLVSAGGPNNPALLDSATRINSITAEINKKLDDESFQNYLQRKPIIL